MSLLSSGMTSVVPSNAKFPLLSTLSSQPSSYLRHRCRMSGSPSLLITGNKCKGAYVCCSVSYNKTENNAKVQNERPLVHFHPDIWAGRFHNFSIEDQLVIEQYSKESEPLKEEVRKMLVDSSDNLRKSMSLIDVVERLGLSYYYKNQINDLVDQFFKQLSRDHFRMNFDLSDTSVQFRIFRQHGYNIPCDVFKKFMDGEGKFEEALKRDEKGMISLYEAAHLKTHGEDILEKALVFTTGFLKSIASFSEEAYQALVQPLHRDIQRVQARHFIRSYMEDDSHNETLLQLAKIDFNRLQLLYRKELSQIKKWWKDFDFERKLPHVKQRVVETHFFSLNMYHEDQYSFARILFSKMVLLLVVLDDTYDAFGTFEELQQLTEAFERCDLTLLEQFSSMKVVYEFVMNTLNDFGNEMTKRGKPYLNYYIKEQVLQMIRQFFICTKWVESRYVPSFEEYMVTRRITSGVRTLVTTALLGMDEVREVKPFEQLLFESSKALLACETMGSLPNDVLTGQMELARGAVIATSVECYMKDHNIESREEVVQIFNQMVEDGWKDLVQTFLCSDHDSDHISKPLLDQILNYSRILHVNYRDAGDAFTDMSNRSIIKKEIIAIFSQPFSI